MKITYASYSENPVTIKGHFHDSHQLIYVVKGRGNINIQGKEYSLQDNTLVILSRFEQHSVSVSSDEYKRYTVRISSDSAVYEPLYSILVNRYDGFCHTSVIDAERIFSAILTEYSEKQAMYEKMLESLLNELLVLVCRNFPYNLLRNDDMTIVQKIQSTIERDYAKKITLASIASEHHISVSHLSHLFKKITGYSPVNYLNECRFIAAKRLLKNTERSVKEIVRLCGFTDESNFSRSFKAKTGITPSEFRSQQNH